MGRLNSSNGCLLAYGLPASTHRHFSLSVDRLGWIKINWIKIPAWKNGGGPRQRVYQQRTQKRSHRNQRTPAPLIWPAIAISMIVCKAKMDGWTDTLGDCIAKWECNVCPPSACPPSTVSFWSQLNCDRHRLLNWMGGLDRGHGMKQLNLDGGGGWPTSVLTAFNICTYGRFSGRCN